MDAFMPGARLVAELSDAINMFPEVHGGEWIELRDFVFARAFLSDFAKRYPDGATVNLQLESDIDEIFAPLVGHQPISGSAVILAALIMGFKVSILGSGMLRVELPR
jgi:hypothetical protein